MARYGYRCGSCGKVFEVEHGMTEHPNIVCPECGGSGKVISDPCPDCAGTGRTPVVTEAVIEFPAGTHDGDLIRVSARAFRRSALRARRPLVFISRASSCHFWFSRR